MEMKRRSILEGLPSLDEIANQFTPKQISTSAPPPEKVAEVAEKVNFTSRESIQTTVNTSEVVKQPKPKRAPMLHRTGRTAQFTCKTSPEIIDEFYDYAVRNGLKVGETFEMAFAALIEKDKEYRKN